MGLLRYQCTVFIIFIFPIHYENKILGQEGIKNRDFPFYFYFSLQNNNVGGSVNQSIIKKKPN